MNWECIEINDGVDLLQTTILAALDHFAPERPVTKKHKSWVDNSIKRLIWQRDKLYKEVCRSPDDEILKQRFRDLRNRTKLTKSERIVLKEASSVKYLGVLVDEEVTFKDHVELVKKKLNKCFHAVLKSRQVLTQSQMLVNYKTHVKPMIQYGVLIYGGTMYSNLQPILKMQKKIVRCIFHLRFSTSVKEVMNSNKIHTVYELYLYEITKFMLKCLKNEHCIEFLNSMITKKLRLVMNFGWQKEHMCQ